jgi:hypothetical protein
MPWTVERAGTAVHVRIELPVDDWEDLYDAIKTEMEQKTSEIWGALLSSRSLVLELAESGPRALC